jgi:hypothetical protein
MPMTMTEKPKSQLDMMAEEFGLPAGTFAARNAGEMKQCTVWMTADMYDALSVVAAEVIGRPTAYQLVARLIALVVTLSDEDRTKLFEMHKLDPELAA